MVFQSSPTRVQGFRAGARTSTRRSGYALECRDPAIDFGKRQRQSQDAQRAFKGIGRVRIVDDDREGLIPIDRLEAARNSLQSSDTGRDLFVLDAEETSQRRRREQVLGVEGAS